MSLGDQISACVLTYNHVDVIESTLDTVLTQSLPPHEVVVSDDCSTDGTWDRVKGLAARHARIRAIQTPKNGGMAANANYAVAACTRPYVALLHHDDLYRDDLLQKWGSLIDRHDDMAFVFNAYRMLASNKVDDFGVPAGRVDGRWLLEQRLWPMWGCIVRGTAMIRKACWDEVGGMRERFGMLADVDLWMRLARRWAVGYVDEPVISVRHEQPSYYPDIYHGFWSWQRQRILYDIHATNRLEDLNLESIDGFVDWNRFRARMGLETTKWLAYGLVRGQLDVIRRSDEGSTQHDLAPVAALRWLLRSGLELVDSRREQASGRSD